jgi:hypothetical protein
VLQRVLPVVFEIDGETTRFELEVLWKKEEVGDTPASNTEPLQFVIEDEDEDSDEESVEPPSKAAPKPKETKVKKTIPSLAERLLGCLIDLLFCCGFTIPRKVQVDHYKISHVIWCVLYSLSLSRSYCHAQGEGSRFNNGPWPRSGIGIK